MAVAHKELHPPLKWSDKGSEVSVNVELRDITNEKIEFRDNHFLEVTATSGGKQYRETLELLEEIDGAASSFKKTGPRIEIRLKKKGSNKWTRLTKENKKFANITVDWGNYVGSDDEDEEPAQQGGGFPGGFGGGQGFDFGQGMGSGGDSDDEEPPKLDDLEGDEQVEEHTKVKPEEEEHDHSNCSGHDHKH